MGDYLNWAEVKEGKTCGSRVTMKLAKFKSATVCLIGMSVCSPCFEDTFSYRYIDIQLFWVNLNNSNKNNRYVLEILKWDSGDLRPIPE